MVVSWLVGWVALCLFVKITGGLIFHLILIGIFGVFASLMGIFIWRVRILCFELVGVVNFLLFWLESPLVGWLLVSESFGHWDRKGFIQLLMVLLGISCCFRLSSEILVF